MRFRGAQTAHLPDDSARRQGQITQLAFLLLGRDAAIAFLNTEHAALGGRPLDLATASSEGCATVEAELGRLRFRHEGTRPMNAETRASAHAFPPVRDGGVGPA